MPKAKTSKKSQISKSSFIRLRPSTMSAAEVAAKGKAAGLTIRPGLIYEVRRAAKAKKAVAKKKASMVSKTSKMPAKQSKADFVRAHSKLSPQEITAKAKTAGIKLHVRYVYDVRGADRAARKKKRVTSTPTAMNGAAPSINTNAETLLKAVAAEIGLVRAIELLHGERARVHSIMRG
jgi:hypothetical protein